MREHLILTGSVQSREAALTLYWQTENVAPLGQECNWNTIHHATQESVVVHPLDPRLPDNPVFASGNQAISDRYNWDRLPRLRSWRPDER